MIKCFKIYLKNILQLVDIDKLIARLVWFNERTEYLREKPRREWYYEFYIPKKSGNKLIYINKLKKSFAYIFNLICSGIRKIFID